MGYIKSFRVEPGSKIRLEEIDSGFTAKQASRDAAQTAIAENLERLGKAQYLLYADASQSLLIVLQGLDASGKDGTIQHLFSGMNPLGTKAVRFTTPTAGELAHDFLWRVHYRAPAKGEIVVFNRSHYEDVLVVRVHDLVPEAAWSKRYRQINDFEKLLARNGTRILKFYLHISQKEQLSRFNARLGDPTRHWKISESDYTERDFWPQYINAYEAVFEKTSTAYAPWFIIPSDHKWFRNLAISKIVADSLDDMGLVLPPARADINEIRRKYHSAETGPRKRTTARPRKV